MLEYIKYLVDKDYHMIIVYILLGLIIYKILKKIIQNKTGKRGYGKF